MPRRFVLAAFALAVVLMGSGPGASLAQDGSEPVVETEPPIPLADQSVTVYFNAEQGTGGLEDHDGEVYAHTGVFTSESPDEWTCVKNHWPTSDQFTGNRDDTQLTQVGPNRYRLAIEGRTIREYYNDNSTGCTLGAGETIETMNFVFRNSDGSKEGKAEGGADIIVDLGDPDATVLTDITTPSASLVDPLVVGNRDTTIAIQAIAQTNDGTAPQEFTLSVNGTEQVSVADDTLQYDLQLTSSGRRDVVVEATDTDGNTARDSLYAVRAAATQEEPVPDGYEEGINYTGTGSAVLVLQAPNKEFVHAVGEFSDWEVQPTHQMKRETISGNNVRYWTEITGLTPGTEYGFQYLVDGALRIPDPYAKKVLTPNDDAISEQTYPDLKPYPDDKANQLVSVLRPGQSDFSFSSFERPAQEDLVIYELLVRDFIEAHDYQTMQDTLAYLDRLGVNAIELMPVSEYDGNESWGYNPSMHLAADKYYGPANELKQLVEAAHQQGIAVILDVVYNHATGQSPLIRLFNEGAFGPPTPENPWANPEARHPFNVFNDLNHESSRTQDWLDRANEYWLTEFNVDGFRFDLSKGFTQTDTRGDVAAWSSYDQSRIDLLQRMADDIWSVDEEAYIILEHFAATQEEQALASYKVDQGRPGMMLWNNMNEPYSQAAQGYMEGSDLANTYYENRGLSVPNYITYMESHDEQWLMYRNRANGNSNGEGYDITELETALQRQKLVGSFFFTVPGPRMLWQFGELGYGYGNNGEQCLEGSGDECPSAAPGRTAPKPIRWDYRNPDQSPDRVALYKTWSALINLRQEHDVFTAPETDVRLRVDAETRGRRIELQHPSMDAVVVGNFGVEARDVTADFPAAGTWYDYFTGEAVQIEEEERGDGIPMAPGEFHIYTSAPVDTPEAGLVPYDAVAPPPTAPTNVEASGDLEAGTASLAWEASAASDVTGYQVYRGTTATFDTTGQRLAIVGEETTSYTDSTVTQGTAYYYRVVAQDNDGMRSSASSSARVLLRPSTVAVSASRSFGDGSTKSDYRLVALPGQVSRGLGDTFQGTAGDAWQAYWDDGSAEDYLQKFDGSSTFDFASGRGFWAISESSWSVEDEFTSVSLVEDAGRQVAIISLRQGWNIISNPLAVDVPWSEVEAANDGTLQPLWRFDGSFSQTGTFASARQGEAFYFHNQEGRARLKVPFVAGDNSAESASEQTAAADLLTVTARGPDGATSTVRVGRGPDAENGVGTEDVIAPPSQFESLSLRVRANDGDASARSRSLARSLRATGEDDGGEAYELVLRATPDAPVRVSVENLPAAGTTVRLVNRQTGASHDLRSGTSVELSPTEEQTRWALLTGSKSFVEKEQSQLQPESLTLWSNYPNPFRERTTIEYTLPDASDVRLEVYDLLGRRVQVLVDGRKEAGLHRVTWNGRNGGGTAAASGLYIVRLQANGATRSQKMTLVR